MSGLRRSKRKTSNDAPRSKRKKISYVESSTTDTEDEDVTTDQDDFNSRKKQKGKAKQSVESQSDESESTNENTDTSEDENNKQKNTQSTDSDVDVAGSAKKKLRTRTAKKKTAVKKRNKKKGNKKTSGRKKIARIIKDEDLEEETREAEKREKERLKRLREKEKTEPCETDTKEDSGTPGIILQKDPCIAVSKHLSKSLRPHQIEGVKFIWDNLIENTVNTAESPGGGCILAHCMGLGKTLQSITITHTVLKCKELGFKTALIVAPMNTVRNWIEEFTYWCEDGDELDLYNLADIKTNKARVGVLKSWNSNGGVLILGYDMYRIMTMRMTYSGYKKVVAETLMDPGPDIVICDEGHMLKNSDTHISKQLNKMKTRRRLVLTGTPLQNNLIEYHCMVNFVKPGLLGSLKEFRNRFVNPITNGQHIDSTDYDVKIMKKRSHVLHQMLEGFVQRKDYSCLKPYLEAKFEYVIKVRLTPLQIKLYQHYLDTNTNRGNDSKAVNNHGKGSSLFGDYQNLMRVWTHPKALLLHSVQKDKILLHKEETNFITDDESASESDASNAWKASDHEAETGENDVKSMPEVIDSKKESPVTKNTAALTDTSDTDEEEVTKRKSRKSRKVKPAVVDSTDSEAEVEESGSGIKDSDGKDEISEDENSASSESTDEEAEKIPHLKTRRKSSNRYRLRRIKQTSESSDNDNSSDIALNFSPPKEDQWYDKILKEDSQSVDDYQNSLKIVLLFEILRMAEERKEKLLVFSQSLISLDLIESMLPFAPHPENDAREEDSDSALTPTRWYKNVDYFRMDGSTQGHYRQRWINAFNDENDTRSRLFLISTRAGGLGVNLVGANRVVIFDASWNPSHDTQSMFRVYRFGQTKKCYIYRFIAEGTMEEKIYQRQVNKQSLAFRVVDEQQINRHFTSSSLAELYTFTPSVVDPNNPGPLPVVPKDEVLAEILSDPSNRHTIASYHEHDSLLDHQTDQELTEEERKSAWEEYEAAKSGRARLENTTGRPYLPGAGSNWSFGTSGTMTFNLENPTPYEAMTFRLAGLHSMMIKMHSQYEKSHVAPIATIFKRLRQTPMYKAANEVSVRAIAMEVHLRLKRQRQERLDEFDRVRMEYLKLQAEFVSLYGGGAVNPSIPVDQFPFPYASNGTERPSTSGLSVHSNSNAEQEIQSSTSITEIIDITDTVEQS